ncbi:hypothetical protein Kpol_1035p24 [Vanderwaltozyma polyspora DSM 70294]|uniref:Nucleoporin Nup82 n=1 Tax=Vanderwaltozyma polyspora (strain ATCC 22028 / DSM 70294 / BCRC 21397 / CBS 2163 / NBRC 10782 / NRRL Y-8283 / UCD 57-17) TaxID=436907 RepID=A7TKI9_VANPO|nr:uncharacterized protein Kpol_1035p24 [Vanderwaltozyma polyspora DSM 70294]EDO17211.1 hypothetical protein Kpol_1035p24 [Vanderwaltozyma polyspora DSM 70294]
MSFELNPIFKRPSVSRELTKRFFFSANNGTRIILFQDSTIRWSFSSDNDHYQSMALRDSDMDVTGAIISDPGDYLCLYNSHQIRVIEIPWGLTNVDEISNSMASSLQERVYNFNEDKLSVKQVLFHPLSKSSPFLVVLFSGSQIAFVDLKNVFKSSDIPIDCFLNLTDSNVMGIDNRVENIQYVVFADDCLSLYSLTDTDVYCFYPCLPPVASLSKNRVDELINKSIVLYENLGIDADDIVRKNVIKQLQLASSLRKKIEEFENANGEVEVNVEIDLEFRQTKAQGYFSISPYPESLYTCTGKQISVLPIGEGNELFLVSFDNGTVLVVFKDKESTMSWDVNDYSFNNSFTLVEIIKFKPEELSNMVVLQGELGKFVVSGEKSTILVDTTKWSSVISKCIRDNDLRPLVGLEMKSTITHINSDMQINSCGIWNSGEAKSLLLVDTNVVVGYQLFKKEVEFKPESAEEISTELENFTLDKFTVPENELKAANYKFQEAVSVPYSKVIPANIKQVPFGSNAMEEQLKILNDISRDVGSKIVQGQSLGLMLYDRLLEQQDKLSEQLIITNKILIRAKKVQGDYPAQLSKLDEKLKKQEHLEKILLKMESNLNTIQESQKLKSLPLSEKEIQLFKELRSQILLFNNFVHKQKDQKQNIQFLKKELQKIIDISRSESSKGMLNEWEELRQILADDAKIIKECNEQLTQISKELDTKNTVTNS